MNQSQFDERTKSGLHSDFYLVIFLFEGKQEGSIFCRALLKDVNETWYKTSRNKKTKKMRKIVGKLLTMDQFGVDIFLLPLEYQSQFLSSNLACGVTKLVVFMHMC